MIASIVMLAALSASETILQKVEERLAVADSVDGMARFVDYSKGAPDDRFAANPKFWGKGIDFSCASPWNGAGGSQRAGTLISKRHIVFANHFPISNGTRLVFVGEDGGVCPCYMVKSVHIKHSDIVIGLLNAEVTPNIRPAKILPADYELHIGDGQGLPVVTMNQREEALLGALEAIPTNGTPWRTMGSYKRNDVRWARLEKGIGGGDSGNPAFLLVGNELVLLYCLTNRGTKNMGNGGALHLFRCEIQKAMDELCPGYKLEMFDFAQMTSGK